MTEPKGRFVFTAKAIDFIKANRLSMSGKAMARALGCSKSVVGKFMRSNGLSVSKELAIQFRSQGNAGRTTFSKKEDKIIRDKYLTTPLKQIGKEIGRSFTGIASRLKAMGLEVPAEIIQQRKQVGRFVPGITPVNKGKKQIEFMSPEGIERTKSNRFKPGQISLNAKPDFTISIRVDKRGVKYYFIRIGAAKWISLHRYNWEKKNGPLSKGTKLIFKDGDTLNCSLDNLEPLTAAELMKRNTYHNYPKEIGQIIQLRGALTRKIKTRTKKVQNEK